jgi:isocitrate/isopropylmalate dehydrogenase
MKAVETVTAKRIHTPDLGGEATTEIVTQAVIDVL